MKRYTTNFTFILHWRRVVKFTRYMYYKWNPMRKLVQLNTPWVFWYLIRWKCLTFGRSVLLLFTVLSLLLLKLFCQSPHLQIRHLKKRANASRLLQPISAQWCLGTDRCPQRSSPRHTATSHLFPFLEPGVQLLDVVGFAEHLRQTRGCVLVRPEQVAFTVSESSSWRHNIH